MKVVVVYFSLTGNTRQIAEAIQAGIIQVIGDCDLVKLKEADARDLSNYDVIGLGSPVWRLGVPPNVLAFINGLPSLEGKHVFPFCTHGALPVGFMKKIASALLRKRLTIIGHKDWYGSCYLQHIPKPYLTDGHPDAIDLREAVDFGREMAERSQKIQAGETNLIPELPEGEGADLLWQIEPFPSDEITRVRRITQTQRKVNMQKCHYPECTLCVDNCPMNSIDFSVTPPVFKSNCYSEFFCEAICPEGAIEIDFGPLTVVHDIPVKNRFVGLLEEAEAKGIFRRLVPLEKVGWNTHFYEVTSHPRLIPD